MYIWLGMANRNAVGSPMMLEVILNWASERTRGSRQHLKVSRVVSGVHDGSR